MDYFSGTLAFSHNCSSLLSVFLIYLLLNNIILAQVSSQGPVSRAVSSGFQHLKVDMFGRVTKSASRLKLFTNTSHNPIDKNDPVNSNNELIIFYSLGELVEVPFLSTLNTDKHPLIWDTFGRDLESGFYFYSLRAISNNVDKYSNSKKNIIIK